MDFWFWNSVHAFTFIDMSHSIKGSKAIQEFRIIKRGNIYMACVRCSWALHIVQASIVVVLAHLLFASNSELTSWNFLGSLLLKSTFQMIDNFLDTWISNMPQCIITNFVISPTCKRIQRWWRIDISNINCMIISLISVLIGIFSSFLHSPISYYASSGKE